MVELAFTWDERKARENVRKHGVAFAEARTAFSDENALLIGDPDHSDREDRFVLLGLSVRLRLLVVVHASGKGDDTVRVISARRATRREEAQYSRRSNP